VSSTVNQIVVLRVVVPRS